MEGSTETTLPGTLCLHETSFRGSQRPIRQRSIRKMLTSFITTLAVQDITTRDLVTAFAVTIMKPTVLRITRETSTSTIIFMTMRELNRTQPVTRCVCKILSPERIAGELSPQTM